MGCGSASKQPCDATPVAVSALPEEITTLKQYITSKGIQATADERGFYYTIQKPGTGAKPTVCSEVTVNYVGKLTNGETFDSGNDVSFGLNQLVLGWQEGIPLVAPGGKVTLYLPPSLAYGSQEQPGIPANSILVFDIDLVNVR
jgi:FKBP-type peptidyl-prolyl cis-trans isomerase FkpA